MKFRGTSIFNNTPIEIGLTDKRVQSLREVTDAPTDLWFAPALIDIQVNGFAGFDINVPTVVQSDVSAMVRELWKVGTGFFCPTVVTGSFEQICHSLQVIVAACKADSMSAHSILGIHLEGPYISAEDGPRGAHPLAHVREPDWDEFQRWQDIADGKICLVTLAPEREGAIPFIEKLTDDGIVAAVGHTNATETDIQAAIRAGAKLSTHLGNGAHAQLRRHPNYIWEQLAADELWASLIVDGHHLPPTVVKSMVRAKTHSRCILISDAVALAGMDSGRYQFAGKTVELTTERCVRLVGTEYLAGAAIELARGIENSVKFTKMSLAEAVTLATIHPARLLGREEQIGNPSKDVLVKRKNSANLILFRWDAGRIEITAMILKNRLVYHSTASP